MNLRERFETVQVNVGLCPGFERENLTRNHRETGTVLAAHGERGKTCFKYMRKGAEPRS